LVYKQFNAELKKEKVSDNTEKDEKLSSSKSADFKNNDLASAKFETILKNFIIKKSLELQKEDN